MMNAFVLLVNIVNFVKKIIIVKMKNYNNIFECRIYKVFLFITKNYRVKY